MSRRRLLASGGGGDPVVIPDPLPGDGGGDPDPTLVWRQITNRTGSARDAGVVGGTSPTIAMGMTVRVAADQIKVVVGGHNVFDAGLPTYTGSLLIGGITYPVTFGGQSSWAMTGPYASRVSDPITVTVEPGDAILPNITTTPRWKPSNGAGWAHEVGEDTGAPLRLLGHAPSSSESWLLSGDSITEQGYSQQAVEAAGKAWSHVANFGEFASAVGQRINRPAPRYGDDPAAWSHAIVGLGTNDLTYEKNIGTSNAAAIAALQLHLLMHWNWCASGGQRVYAVTIPPRSLSTDSWTTVGNQTDEIPSRITFNNWLRDGAPIVSGVAVAAGTGGALRAGSNGHPLAGYIDVADSIETARDSGKWIVGYTDDGIHPTTAGTNAMRAAVAAWMVDNDL